MAEINIKINGTQYPCRLTMGALLAFKRQTGQDISSFKEEVDIEKMLILLGCCIESACRADGLALPEGFCPDTLADHINLADAYSFWTQGDSEGNLQSQAPKTRT